MSLFILAPLHFHESSMKMCFYEKKIKNLNFDWDCIDFINQVVDLKNICHLKIFS